MEGWKAGDGMMRWLESKLALSRQGAKDLLLGSLWSLLAYISLMIPVVVFFALLGEILVPVMQGQSAMPGLLNYAGLCLVCLLIMFVFHWLQYGSVFVSTYDESAKRRVLLAEKLRKLPLSFFGQRDLSDLTSTIMSDCEGMEHAFSHAIPQLIGGILSSFLVSVGLCMLDWRLGLSVLWVLPVAFAVIIATRRIQDKAGRKHLDAKITAADGIQECLETVREIKACNRKKQYLAQLDEKLESARKTLVKSELTASVFLAAGQAFLRLGLATVVLAGGWLLLAGEIDILILLVFLMAGARIYDPVSGALANIAEVFNVKLKIDRTRQIENQPTQTGTEEYVTNGYDIRFDQVSFAYNADEPVLRGVSFTAKQGEVTALVGPSGSGKSTAAKLAARFWDVQAGTITLGGTDIAAIEPEALLKNYAIVFQDVTLFNDSIMGNIRLGRKDASDEEVIAAAKAARCDDFVQKMPDKYNTEVGENGSTLSGGERQRISIARAILKNAPVVLLDEATASLDVESETQVQQALSHLIEGKTVLIIAHRMRTVSGADKIVVLDAGKIVEQGTPAELYANSGLYARMVALQKESRAWTI
jgi:ATP-binding cassette subfamily B protein